MTDTKDLAARLEAEVEQDVKDLRGVHGGAPSLRGALERICTRIQQGSLTKDLPNADKRALAVELGIRLLRRVVPAGWLAYVPEPVQRFILGWMVDKVVAFFKAKGWPGAAKTTPPEAAG